MKTKVFKRLLPIMAIMFAIGLSFASVTIDALQAKDYIFLGGGDWQEIDEIPCTKGAKTCRVQMGANGLVYDVYDQKDLSTKKVSNNDTPFVINP